MIDVVARIVNYYINAPEAATLRSLLGEKGQSKVTADFDPENVARPYVVVLQNHYDNSYEPCGRACRVEKIVVQCLAFTDTRAECIAILNALGDCLLTATIGLGTPTIADKVAQLDVSRIDAWKGTLNLVYWAQQNQTAGL